MYNRLYKFPGKKELIHSSILIQRKKLTNNALIHLTEKIRKQLDDNNYDCGIFVDFQKAFVTVDHNVLLKTLENHTIRGNSNKWFASYLTNRKQFISISGFYSNLAVIKCLVPQSAILDSFLFSVYK